MSAKMVRFATPQGATFHVYRNCPGTGAWVKEVDTRMILLRGLRPCKKCSQPRAESVTGEATE